MYCIYWLQNHKTPLHLAACFGHVEVLRVFVKDYHANKMVKAMVNEYHSQCMYPFLCLYTRHHLLLCVS